MTTITGRARHWALATGCAMGLLSGQAPAQDAGRIIVLINPNSNEGATQSMAELAQAAVGDAATVEGRSNAGAPALLTTPQDMADAIPGVVAIGTEAASDPRVAALIVSAFSDPGLPELREAVGIPVLGIGEEVFHEAARGGRPFGIVTVTPDGELIESFRQKAVSLGYEAQYRGVRVTPGDPGELVQDPARLDAALADAVRQSVGEDGAEAVIMGGGPLSASAVRLQPQFEQPLVVAVTAAARAAVKEIATED
ncbi:aspartate/glutamate racemase family protein [Paracoccus sp. APAP_BH8]|uniref:Aspartate/glutamate racemase family protein n=2 Tax=Paracoccus pantotrophus TaxID=82367 RepID=A0A7H9BVW7_PARPN|nr:aspartate/glutamate racemase family protein [Paracoccus pantotrophus]MDF3856403.1 aspartate/glutamate racemase family protein [Paracoccus pantotrophus]QLH14968.1 aspartate/glutamate racemase family protein [Paracoccus pantotrophus]RDD99785.1 hydantoin racemase [Paracoccus pantotrophus]RNI15561.1 hydantoin racemase [Paracoccus pantotrophus]WGR65387.1 hydantoin racemase [Paracoccus pantotrophus]